MRDIRRLLKTLCDFLLPIGESNKQMLAYFQWSLMQFKNMHTLPRVSKTLQGQHLL